MHRILISVVALSVVAAAVASCGGDAGSPTSPSMTAPADVPSAVATEIDQPVGERLIDVGGYKLAIRCQGQGAPTVVVETGALPIADDFGNTMSSQVARERRVCTYDRAGTGKSDAGPNPRDGEQIAKELDQLLVNAGETGPFILVSWSIAGLYTPLYAVAHPDKVAGYVFIDPRLASYQLEVGTDPRVTASAAQLPAAYGEEVSAWDETAREVLAAGPLPVRPLVVLTAGSPAAIALDNLRTGGFELWSGSHEALASSVAGGKHVVVPDAEHAIWDADPGAVLDAIRDVATTARD